MLGFQKGGGMLTSRKKYLLIRGFTLVELMVTLAVLAVLIGIALPSFSSWLRNIEIRNAAESVLNGVQRARAEAVGRNASVAFVLSENSSWAINLVSTGAAIESRSAADGSQNVTRTVTPNPSSTVTFSNLGVVIANADASAQLQQIDFSGPSATRSLRVTIGVGGNARMCDPNLATGSSVSAC